MRRLTAAVAALTVVLVALAGPSAARTAEGPPERPTAREARETARDILSEPRFGDDPDRETVIDRAVRWIGEQLDKVVPDAPASGAGFGFVQLVVWILLVALVAAAVVVLGLAIARRKPRPKRVKDASELDLDELDGDLGEYEHERDADVLERAADDAAARGDFALAVRLRFRAGLLRLDEAGAIEFRPSLTTGQVARSIPSRAFVPVGVRFDEIAYGGRSAGPPDDDSARSGWRAVLEEVGTS